MHLLLSIRISLQSALRDLFSQNVTVDDLHLEITNQEHVGDFTFVVFPYLRASKLSPEKTGSAIGEYLLKNSNLFSGYNIVKGFLNLKLNQETWFECFNWITKNPGFGNRNTNGKKVMVEYSAPNTNKPLHLGHMRNNFIGWSVSEILKENGYEVIKANLVNDRGIHICKSMLAWMELANDATPESTGKKGDHFVGDYYVRFEKEYRQQVEILVAQGKSQTVAEKEAPWMLSVQELLRKWESGDTEIFALWKKMNQWVYDGFNHSYKRMGVDFDKWYYESETYLLGKKMVEEGLEKGIFYKKDDNSVWINLSDLKLDDKLLLRSDGTSVYITQDLGTADLKYNDYGMDVSVYVIADEQNHHIKLLKAILKKLGKHYADGIYHLSYGMVDLPEGKMKSREGTVVDADELMDEMVKEAEKTVHELGKTEGMSQEELFRLYEILGLGAIKYFLLKVDPKKKLLFNPAESLDLKGNTAAFIQYTHARICALFRKKDKIGISSSEFQKEKIPLNHLLFKEEREMLLQLSHLSFQL